MTTTDDDVPLFGAGADHRATRPFRIEVHHYATDTTWVEEFQAKVDPGPGLVIAFLRAGNMDEDTKVKSAARLILGSVLDYDGTPAAAIGNITDIPESAPEAWSSRARFELYVDSPDHHMASDVLTDLAEWITKGAFGRGGAARPTGKPSASSSGPTRTRRSSTAARSSNA